MKRIIITIIYIVTILSFTACAIAEVPVIKVDLDGHILAFDQNPIIQNGRVLVPLRKIFESLNAAVYWDPGTQTITAVKDGNTVILTMGASAAYINSSLINLDQPPVIVNERTLVPVRFVSEALGARVEWEPEAQTVKIFSIATESISCSALGMIPNDEKQGEYNYCILIAEAKKGTKINVDGKYYIRSLYSACVSENEVQSLSLSGGSPATSKLVLKGGTYFNIKGKALIENVSIECPSTSLGTQLISMKAPFVNEITIRGNYITGNIKLINSSVPLDYNFASTPCSIKQLVVENNEFYDVYNTWGSKIIISLTDTPVKSSYIRNNKVTDFSYIFYSNGVTNNHPSGKYIKESNNAVIEGNKVICTDDYDAAAKNDGYLPMYYCFALIEGFNVECRGNTFEGFHISDAPDTLVYDNYLSVTKLLYENNTWKNNVNFTADVSCVDIMKSKQANEVAGVEKERIYRGNTYIVEPGYADRFGKDRFLLRKEINTYQTDIDRIIIEDNYFDMYILSFNRYGQIFNDLYQFSGNTVLMDTIENSMTSQAYAFVKEMIDDSGNVIYPRNLIFTNNKITCGNKAFGQGIGTEKYYVLYDIAGSADKTTVDFSNNTIDVPGLESVPPVIKLRSDCGTAINFTGNSINGKEVKMNQDNIK